MVVLSRGATAIPTEASTSTSTPQTWKGPWIWRRTRRPSTRRRFVSAAVGTGRGAPGRLAAVATVGGTGIPRKTRANSSPPARPTKAGIGRSPDSVRAMICSSRSPPACPSASLISWNRLMSTRTRIASRPSAWISATALSPRSRVPARLARCVSGSAWLCSKPARNRPFTTAPATTVESAADTGPAVWVGSAPAATPATSAPVIMAMTRIAAGVVTRATYAHSGGNQTRYMSASLPEVAPASARARAVASEAAANGGTQFQRGLATSPSTTLAAATSRPTQLSHRCWPGEPGRTAASRNSAAAPVGAATRNRRRSANVRPLCTNRIPPRRYGRSAGRGPDRQFRRGLRGGLFGWVDISGVELRVTSGRGDLVPGSPPATLTRSGSGFLQHSRCGAAANMRVRNLHRDHATMSGHSPPRARGNPDRNVYRPSAQRRSERAFPAFSERRRPRSGRLRR